MKPVISAVIISKNEASMIEACLKTVQWCDEIVLIDDGSTDKTTEIAENFGAKVVSFKHESFSRKRQEGLKRAKGDWIFYIDADERVTPILAREIMVNAETGEAPVLSLKRKNIFYGTHLEHGGWDNDVVERVFKKDNLQGWKGDIHESPVYKGQIKELSTPLIHLSHRDTVSGLLKTAAWTPIEAQALFDSKLKPVSLVTIFRKGMMEFFRRGFLKKGYKDGQTGLVEALIQGINRMLVYIQVWEMQQNPSIKEKYANLEVEIQELWKKKI